MADHFLNHALHGQDAECVTDVFMSQNQQHSMQMISSMELPRIMESNIGSSFKDHMYNLELKPMVLKEKLESSNDVSSTIQSGPVFVSQGQMTDYAEGYGRSTEGFINLEIQEQENEGETLTVDVDESALLIDDSIYENDDGATLNGNNAQVDSSEQDYEGLQDVIEFIRENEGSDTADFFAIPSDKSRNPPYLLKDTINIITKNNEPIKFCLQGADINQIVTVTMRYTEEKYKNNPVLACKLDRKEDSFPFVVSPAGEEIELTKETINDHPTVHFSLPAQNLDSDNGCFPFYVTVVCLNSCHKNNGKKIQLIMKLVDPQANKIIRESRFNIRACKNVKRDFKEAFPDGETSPEKLLKPDSFIKPRENQSQPKEEVKSQSIVMTKPPVQKAPEKKIIACTTSRSETPKERKCFLVQLPTLETEKNVLDTVKLFGGKIFNLESVYVVNDNNTNPDVA
ncbi:uncharacterized protein [Palaemon carinicauda]|uniref:uncharacterized protein n=1 Tax=Palaemon carinicauda TaxID=392227 RepID=UPI0035B5ABA5